jgi:hypothetical protein
MKEKVYNHYVPQFLMRNFSDNGNSIGQYIKNYRSYIKDASIKKICGANYLYGKTSELEDILCDLESLWAKSIKKICIKESAWSRFVILTAERREKETSNNYE